MSSLGTLSAALEFVPNWWHETTDPTSFDPLLVGWVRACGWRSAGFIWPTEANISTRSTQGSTVQTDRLPPAEMPDAVRRIRSGESTVLYPTPATGGRVYVGVVAPGRPLALLWAEKIAGQPWTETERSYMILTARTLERSPVLAAMTGVLIDPDQLSRRLNDAGIIAGRVAHEFNNILNGVIGFADLSVPLITPGSQAAGYVAEIAKVGQRGTAFTQQLHQFSHSGHPRPTPGSVAAVVNREEVRLRLSVTPGLKFEKDIPQNVPGVAVDAEPLQGLLGHLLANAQEACVRGGTVRITAQTVELTEAEARSFLGKATAGQHLLVTITDSGEGIKPEVRRRLFAEPFFTTKMRHRGVGLAIVFRTLVAHRGGVQIDPVPLPGVGTQVRVVLPLAVSRTSTLSSTPLPNQDGIRRGGNLNTTIVGG